MTDSAPVIVLQEIGRVTVVTISVLCAASNETEVSSSIHAFWFAVKQSELGCERAAAKTGH